LYSSSSKIIIMKSREIKWAGYVARKEGKRNTYRILVRNLEGKRPLRRQRCRWVIVLKLIIKK
jgi:hypothetical protein